MLIEYPPERIPRFLDELIALHEKAFEPPKVAPKPAPAPAAASEAAAPEPKPAPRPAPAGPRPLPEELGGPVEGLEVTELAGFPDELPEEFSAEAGEGSGDFGVLAAASPENIWVAGHEANEAGYLPEGDVMPQAQGGEAALPSAWTVADLAIGSWVELQLKGEWVRAQLTWASPHRTLFMFISGKGLAHSMSRRTMDQLRSRGLMRVVSERHVVDNALDAVAQTALRNQTKT